MLVAEEFEIEAQFQRPFFVDFFFLEDLGWKFYLFFPHFYPVFDCIRVYFQVEMIKYMYSVQGSIRRKFLVTFFLKISRKSYSTKFLFFIWIS